MASALRPNIFSVTLFSNREMCLLCFREVVKASVAKANGCRAPQGQRRQGWCHRGVDTSPRRIRLLPRKELRRSVCTRADLLSVLRMGRRYETISFLTDFGSVDEFVGVVKSVIRDIAEHAVVIDLTHQIAPFDVRAGSLALARSISYVPAGIVLAVVDPGVGTDRHCVAIEVADGDGVLIGPDNGLLAPAVALAGGAGRAVVLTNMEYQLEAPGSTFAARDIMGPAAAHLCNGVDLYDLGEPIDPALLMPGTVPLPREEQGAIVVEVLWVDRYGNCQLNVGPDEISDLGDRVRILVGELAGTPLTRVGRRCDNFSEIGTGSVGLVTDSYGMIAICLDRRSAAEELHIGPGDQVVLEVIDDENPGYAPDGDNDHGSDGGPVSTPVNLRISR